MPKTGTVEVSTELKTLFKAEVPTSVRWMSFVNGSGAARDLEVWFKPQGGVASPVSLVTLSDKGRLIEERARELVAGDVVQGKANGTGVSFEIETVAK